MVLREQRGAKGGDTPRQDDPKSGSPSCEDVQSQSDPISGRLAQGDEETGRRTPHVDVSGGLQTLYAEGTMSTRPLTSLSQASLFFVAFAKALAHFRSSSDMV